MGKHPEIRLQVAAGPDRNEKRCIVFTFGDYLWIGDPREGGACFGVVRDRDVTKLRDWCEQIMNRPEKLDVAAKESDNG